MLWIASFKACEFSADGRSKQAVSRILKKFNCLVIFMIKLSPFCLL